MKKLKIVLPNTKKKWNISILDISIFIILCVYVISLFIPIIWATYTSFNDKLDYLKFYSLKKDFPTKLVLDNFKIALTEYVYHTSNGYEYTFVSMIGNSLVYSVGCAFFFTLTPCLVAYCAARFTKEIAPKLRACIAESAAKGCPVCKELQTLDHYLVKRSQWIIGGDGASYDIGYGGLDHVIASGEDVNILVLDTEVYSNTGGQASKATPLGAIAQFAAQGKRIRKKDLGMIATTYGYVYVAQIAMGADHAQCLKAIREAEAWHGPSIVIAYAPCINHGLKAKGGMGKSQAEEKKAVACGYWHLWRYNPALIEEGKNPFSLDSKEPNWADFHDFLLGEVRYLSVKKAYPNEAEELFAEAQRMAQLRYKSYVRKTQENWSQE